MLAARGAPIQTTGTGHDYKAVYIAAQSIGGIAAMHIMVLTRPVPATLPQLRQEMDPQTISLDTSGVAGRPGMAAGVALAICGKFQGILPVSGMSMASRPSPRIFIISPPWGT